MWLLRKRDEILGLYSIIVFAAFLYVIGCYQDWDGLSSFGNRFFVSLTVLFVLGLAGFIDYFARAWNERRSLARRSSRHNPADSLEFWTHLPMGHAPDSRSRPDFLAPGSVQSSNGSAGPDRRNSEALRYPPRPIDA